jgi:hypothetical protein
MEDFLGQFAAISVSHYYIYEYIFLSSISGFETTLKRLRLKFSNIAYKVSDRTSQRTQRAFIRFLIIVDDIRKLKLFDVLAI